MADKILFLCCCSNRKFAGGERSYRKEDSAPHAISDQGRVLLESRTKVFQRIQDGASSTQGTPLRDLPYNDHTPLVHGPDLGGNATGKYLPAMKRYRGRFYDALDPEEKNVLNESPHHWLIVSALYGLLTPEEPIQRYSCHTLDDAELTKIWTKDGLLTTLLLSYVRAFEVGLIVNLMADASYHGLFNWERVLRNVRVLWAFGAQNTGPGLLPALGFLAQHRLLRIPGEELFRIREPETYITDYEDVVLMPCGTTPIPPVPPPGFLSESQPPEETVIADLIAHYSQPE